MFANTLNGFTIADTTYPSMYNKSGQLVNGLIEAFYDTRGKNVGNNTRIRMDAV